MLQLRPFQPSNCGPKFNPTKFNKVSSRYSCTAYTSLSSHRSHKGALSQPKWLFFLFLVRLRFKQRTHIFTTTPEVKDLLYMCNSLTHETDIGWRLDLISRHPSLLSTMNVSSHVRTRTNSLGNAGSLKTPGTATRWGNGLAQTVSLTPAPKSVY